jgi:hypothetical protein
MTSPQLLSAYERCNRSGVWSRDWRKWKMSDAEMLQRSIRAGLRSDRKDFNIASGEETMTLSAEPGLETKEYNVFDQCVHLAALSDIITAAVRKPSERPWLIPEDVRIGDGPTWRSAAYLSPDRNYLRRIAVVSNWGDDRHFGECRGWFSLGEMVAYSLPMQLVVAVIGSSRGGKRHSPWTKGLLHPVNKRLRFKKKNSVNEPFKATWLPVWREDHDEITSESWLQSMLDDYVLQDHLFKIDIPLPTIENQKIILDLAVKKLDEIQNANVLPDQQYSTCDTPDPCLFRSNCHSGNLPSWKHGFVPVDQVLSR